jgi:hypothetical protein
MKKKLINLAIDHDFSQESHYFQYIVDSWIVGQRKQALSLFNAMRKEDKKEFLNSINETMTTNSNELKNYIIDNII